ncbi:hypothetical protein A4X13_0g7875 [Tilletia indica]|uniref:Uncharacterized protein n=1 Tax=Tilletia indica TaxID=43049 RepID=A0A177TF16_9BASI|nr:hypothetical protein A4X13_0g7875 [Tilletia indica]
MDAETIPLTAPQLMWLLREATHVRGRQHSPSEHHNPPPSGNTTETILALLNDVTRSSRPVPTDANVELRAFLEKVSSSIQSAAARLTPSASSPASSVAPLRDEGRHPGPYRHHRSHQAHPYPRPVRQREPDSAQDRAPQQYLVQRHHESEHGQQHYSGRTQHEVPTHYAHNNLHFDPPMASSTHYAAPSTPPPRHRSGFTTPSSASSQGFTSPSDSAYSASSAPPHNAIGTRQGNGEHPPNYHTGPVLSHNNSPDRSSNGVGYVNHNGPAPHHNLGGTPHTNNRTAAPVQRRHNELPPFHNAGPPSNYNNGATVPGFFVNDGGAPHPNNVNTTSNPYRHNDPPPASNTGPSPINLNGVTHHHTNGSSAPLNHSNDRGPLQNTGQTAYNPNHVGQAHNPDVPVGSVYSNHNTTWSNNGNAMPSSLNNRSHPNNAGPVSSNVNGTTNNNSDAAPPNHMGAIPSNTYIAAQGNGGPPAPLNHGDGGAPSFSNGTAHIERVPPRSLHHDINGGPSLGAAAPTPYNTNGTAQGSGAAQSNHIGPAHLNEPTQSNNINAAPVQGTNGLPTFPTERTDLYVNNSNTTAFNQGSSGVPVLNGTGPTLQNNNGTGQTPVNSGVGLPNNVGIGPTTNIGGAAPLHQNNVGGSSFGNVAFNNVPSHFNSGNVYYTTQPCLRDGTAASATEAFEAPPPAPPLTQPGPGPWLGSWGPN